MMEFRIATVEHGLEILANLREEQQRTIAKLGLDAEELLRKAIANEYPSITAFIDGQPAAMFGGTSATLLGEVRLWMLTTPLSERNPIAFLRQSRRMTEWLFNTYGPVLGIVDVDFEKSRRWLCWIGFKEISVGEYIVMRYSGGH